MEKLFNGLVWFFASFGVAFVIVGALATPAMADGCDCSYCIMEDPPACCVNCINGCDCSQCTGSINDPLCCANHCANATCPGAVKEDQSCNNTGCAKTSGGDDCVQPGPGGCNGGDCSTCSCQFNKSRKDCYCW
jgi:hypothetical protein